MNVYVQRNGNMVTHIKKITFFPPSPRTISGSEAACLCCFSPCAHLGNREIHVKAFGLNTLLQFTLRAAFCDYKCGEKSL